MTYFCRMTVLKQKKRQFTFTLKLPIPDIGRSYCRLRWRGDLVQGRLGDPPLGRSGHQHADTSVVDGKWRLLINNTALYSLGLQHHFHLLTSRVKRYWLLGEGGHTLPFRTARHLQTAKP